MRNPDKTFLEEDPHVLYDNAPCGYVSSLPDGILVKANATFLKWTGYRSDDLLGKTRFQDLLPVAGKIYHDTHYAPLLQMQGYVREVAFEIVCEDGQRLPVLVNSTLHRDAAGNPQLARITLLDARGRRSYEQELLAARRRAEAAEASLRLLAQGLEQEVAARTAERDRLWRISQDVLAIGSADGHFLAFNPAFTSVLGWTDDELKAMRFDQLVHPDDTVQFNSSMELLAAGQPVTVTVRRRHKNGSYRWLSWNIVPDGGLLYFVGRDVTEEKTQAETLIQTEEALRQAQKMEAVGQLTGGIAHDFNNMLAGVMASLEMLQLRVRQGRTDDIARYIESGLAMVDRAAALTHRLLAFSRRQTLDPKPTDANRLVESMKDLIQRTLGPTISLETSLQSGLEPTLCDPNQLESALLNLAINSRDAMPEGGRLTIDTANVTLGSDSAVAEVEPGEYIRIGVRDTGAGMTDEVLDRAMDPFFTTKPIGQGTGLGLSMVYGFAKQSKGHVRILSKPGAGTTVQLFLPRHYGDTEAEDTAGAGTGVASAAGHVAVLLVDDEEAIRTLSAEMLRDAGYTVIEAPDAVEGLKLLRSLQRLDLLITDVGLPNGMNGRQLADAGREIQPGLKVLFITGFAEDTAVGNGSLEAGMQVMTKPFSMAAFATKVGSMIEKP